MIVFMTSVLFQFSKMVFCCFPGGVAVPQYGPRGCAGPRLKAAPLQPKRSSPTTESHGAPVGARQCTPSPPSRMSNPEILSPPDLLHYACLSFFCPFYSKLWAHCILVSLPQALNLHCFWDVVNVYLFLFTLYSHLSISLFRILPGCQCFIVVSSLKLRGMPFFSYAFFKNVFI